MARLGGDEFVVAFAGLSTSQVEAAAQAETLGHTILSALNRTYQLQDVVYYSTPSIGVTLFVGQDTPIADLLKQADLAMYKSKTAGCNLVHFFDPEMEAAVMQRASLEDDLRRAIDEQQLSLHYQAQVLGDGRLTGAEALVRWRHCQRGRRWRSSQFR